VNWLIIAADCQICYQGVSFTGSLSTAAASLRDPATVGLSCDGSMDERDAMRIH
jgi:hypothetical protein